MKINGISEQIGERRREIGLTLAELARKTGTSPATVSRYEKGWDRFEVFTLRKLASALGCRLKVQFEPLPSGQPAPSATAACRKLRRLFWDRPLKVAHFKKYPGWVVQRVLEYGTLSDIQELTALMGRRAFLGHVRNSRFLSPKTEHFWKAILIQEGIPCTTRRSRNTV